eukprot:UN11109
MASNNIVFDKQSSKMFYAALISNNIDSPQKIKQMNQAKFDQIARKFRVDRFAKVRDKTKRSKIDDALLQFEKAW